ncbi:hypothetical protein Hanom_Chr07g00619241 [Helianthus anomalus]
MNLVGLPRNAFKLYCSLFCNLLSNLLYFVSNLVINHYQEIKFIYLNTCYLF